MNNRFYTAAGAALAAGALLLTLTMALHPVGGSLEGIEKMTGIIIISHALAIFALPFTGFGYYGLSAALATGRRWSAFAFIIAMFGLVATMLAAAINGLALPIFLRHSGGSTADNVETVKVIIKYGFALNKAMDYILITAMVLSMGIWSAIIIRGRHGFPKWTGWLGLLLLLLALAGAVLQFNFIRLQGFRVFVMAMVLWLLSVAVYLMRGAGVKEAGPAKG